MSQNYWSLDEDKTKIWTKIKQNSFSYLHCFWIHLLVLHNRTAPKNKTQNNYINIINGYLLDNIFLWIVKCEHYSKFIVAVCMIHKPKQTKISSTRLCNKIKNLLKSINVSNMMFDDSMLPHAHGTWKSNPKYIKLWLESCPCYLFIVLQTLHPPKSSQMHNNSLGIWWITLIKLQHRFQSFGLVA